MSCEIKIPTVQGLDEGVLTVGRIFHLNCPAKIPEGFNFSQAKFDIKDPTHFKILKIAAQDQSQVSIEATFYAPGEWKIEDLILTDSQSKISLGKFETLVQSVLSPDVKPEPYGPIGPLKISVPWLYVTIVGFVVLFMVSFLFIRLRRRWQRNSLLERLLEYETPLSALQQFHAESRRWQRQNSFFHDYQMDKSAIAVLQEINKQVRVFFIRRFQIPALDWNEKLILLDLKKYHRQIHDENQQIIKKWFSEMSKCLSNEANVKAQDIIQLHHEARKMLEKLDLEAQAQSKERKAKV